MTIRFLPSMMINLPVVVSAERRAMSRIVGGGVVGSEVSERFEVVSSQVRRRRAALAVLHERTAVAVALQDFPAKACLL